MRVALATVLLLAGCDRAAPVPTVPNGAGPALERAAIAAGVVADPRALDPVGAYGSDSDRVCVTRDGEATRIGATVDYGEGQGCVARGTVNGTERLKIDFGRDCRFEAAFDGERIVFPATLPTTCDTLCSGRATMGALTAERLSRGDTEARSMRAQDDKLLCES